MKRFALALPLLAAVALLPGPGSAQSPPGAIPGLAQHDETQRCTSSFDGDAPSIACSGVSEGLGRQLAEVLSRIVADRLDPRLVMLKLSEIESVPADGVARGLSDDQRHIIVSSLIGKESQQIAIIAHPQVADSADYARSLATPLLMVGWQVEGNQVRRIAPKNLEDVYGVALVVRDPNTPPEKAVRLKGALTAAKIPTPLVADPTFAGDATLLWIGKRPNFGEVKP